MKTRLCDWEQYFAVLALLFYSELLAFQSMFAMSEGSEGNPLVSVQLYNPLTPLLRLSQHGIFLVVLALLVLRWKKTLVVAKKGVFLWGLTALVLMSFLWSAFPDTTLRNSISLLETTAFGLYLAARFNLKEQLKIITTAGALFTTISLLFSLAVPGHAIESGIHAGSWRGPIIQKNLFAKILALFFMAAYIDKPTGRTARIVRWLTLLVSVGMILLSTSKTAVLVLVVMLCFFHAQQALYQMVRDRNMMIVPAVSLSTLVVGAGVVTLLSNAEKLVTAVGRDLTFSGRTEIWSALVTKISERPVLGYGYQGFWRGLYGESSYVGKVFDNTYIPPHSHNGLFELTLAFGLLGLLLFLASFVRNASYAARLPAAVPVAEASWPLVYLCFLVLYNQTETTLVAHNSIFWALYVAVTFSKQTVSQSVSSHQIISRQIAHR